MAEKVLRIRLTLSGDLEQGGKIKEVSLEAVVTDYKEATIRTAIENLMITHKFFGSIEKP